MDYGRGESETMLLQQTPGLIEELRKCAQEFDRVALVVDLDDWEHELIFSSDENSTEKLRNLEEAGGKPLGFLVIPQNEVTGGFSIALPCYADNGGVLEKLQRLSGLFWQCFKGDGDKKRRQAVFEADEKRREEKERIAARTFLALSGRTVGIAPSLAKVFAIHLTTTRAGCQALADAARTAKFMKKEDDIPF